MKVVSLQQNLEKVHGYWNPLVVGELNDHSVKVVKLKGEFVMHHHDNEDEMFLVIQGTLRIEFDTEIKTVNTGEFIIIPRGVAHKPVAEEEAHVMLFEPQSTLNTGNLVNERTVLKPRRAED